MRKFTALIILDGFGLGEVCPTNTAILAKKPNIDALMETYPTSCISASGLAVGLPEGQMGNSEVGHLNLGAGRVVYQELTRITKAIEDGDFFTNPVLVEAIEQAIANGKALHLLGLVSNGGVHSHMDHLEALVKLAKQKGLEKVYIHAFMDGRDVAPNSGLGFIEELEERLSNIGTGKIATVSGRYYAMDRDNRWERVERAYDALVNGTGVLADSATSAMGLSYEKGEFDEFVQPTVVIHEDGTPTATIESGDSVIFFNFRPDRARELTRALTEPDFDGFDRIYFPLYYVTMTQYDATFTHVHIAFAPESLTNTFGEYISDKGLTQFRIAETEKYAHVTFFFNGGVETPNKGEERVLIPSPKVATYDLQPEMSAPEVARRAAELIRSKKYDVMILNFANPDMVGHTGVLEAAIKAVEAVDAGLGEVMEAIKEVGGSAIITADHGNCEMMEDPVTGGAFTAHTINPVPLILAGDDYKNAKLKETGILADIAPTLLDMLALEKPAEMTGESLIEEK
ncbi:MAG: 2,3-bisphosphoglycerate-independent phosphoglycerate mutase [Christensenellaceae bacterium]|jgi:2,3-bisphosphoglycerate-independent phosphoglycerate mutase